MRRFLAPISRVTGTPTSVEQAADALVGAFVAAIGPARADGLTDAERSARDAYDRRFVDPRWVRAERTGHRSIVKIRNGAGVVLLDEAFVSLVDGRIERVSLGDGWVPASGMSLELERALVGLPLERDLLDAAVRRTLGGTSRGAELVDAIVGAHTAWS
jgi:hypothetical protein